jgi:Zn-dependent protease
MDDSELIQTIAIYALPVLFAITLHEAAHGYMARRCGDMTAHMLGRISLNPMRHIDWFGTIVLPLVMMLVSGGRLLFGWAKPVPVNFSALNHPKRDMAWVAAAGPAANFLMTILWVVLLKVVLQIPENAYSEPLRQMSAAGIQVNLVFMFLNLVPILPLDGGRILTSVLPNRLAWQYARLEPYGMPILIVLLLTNALDLVLNPLMHLSTALIRQLLL